MKKFLLGTGIVLFSVGSVYANTLYADRILEKISLEIKNQEIVRNLTLGQEDVINISDIFTPNNNIWYYIMTQSENLNFDHHYNDNITIHNDNAVGEYEITMQVCKPASIEAPNEYFDLVHEVEIEDEE